MNKVTARFTCQSVKELPASEGSAHLEVEFCAVWGNGKGNESWSKATPNGRLTMTITNPAVVGHFRPGKTYALDLTEVE